MTDTPKWPDFKVTLRYDEERDQSIIGASTDTGRPKTPVFSIFQVVTGRATEEQAKFWSEQRFRRLYDQAHPNGCPGSKRKAEESNPRV